MRFHRLHLFAVLTFSLRSAIAAEPTEQQVSTFLGFSSLDENYVVLVAACEAERREELRSVRESVNSIVPSLKDAKLPDEMFAQQAKEDCARPTKEELRHAVSIAVRRTFSQEDLSTINAFLRTDEGRRAARVLGGMAHAATTIYGNMRSELLLRRAVDVPLPPLPEK